MVTIILKVLLTLALGIVFFQDNKERQVHWVLFPVIGGLAGLLFYGNTLNELFIASVVLNLLFVIVILFIVFMYALLKLRTNPFNTMGLGDILLFVGLSLSFSTISFMIIFVSALVFSLLLHVMAKGKSPSKTVPLAGYMSLFFILTYLSYWTGIIDSLYIV